MRPRRSISGFTLVELLVVIAIIGILAGLIAAGLGPAMERARIANAENNFTQIRTILTAYYTDHDSYPPNHGYLSDQFKGDGYLDPAVILTRMTGSDPEPLLNFPNGEADAFFITPWDIRNGIEIHTNEDLYDTFSNLGYDTDGDDLISRLEFAPIGIPINNGQNFDFTGYDQVYLGDNGASNGGVIQDDAQRQLNSQDRRPYVYIAVNQRQARAFARIMEDEAQSDGTPGNPRPFNLSPTAINRILEMRFPPPRYDACVLISVGPNPVLGTAGILPEYGINGFMTLSDLQSNPSVGDRTLYQYHILGLAAFYLATRDAQGDGFLDFDFKARTRNGQARIAANSLPMPGAENAAGPLIFVIQ